MKCNCDISAAILYWQSMLPIFRIAYIHINDGFTASTANSFKDSNYYFSKSKQKLLHYHQNNSLFDKKSNFGVFLILREIWICLYLKVVLKPIEGRVKFNMTINVVVWNELYVSTIWKYVKWEVKFQFSPFFFRQYFFSKHIRTERHTPAKKKTY